VFCQLNTLRQSFPSSIRHILNELPTILDETYERILLDIPEERWKHANRLLQCLFVSFRPLRVEELAEVLAIRFSSEKTPDLITSWRQEDAEDAVLSACSSLITVVKANDSRVVQFSHFSVKEFLTSNRLATSQDRNVSRYHIPPEPAHKIIAQACLSTLLELGDGIDKNGLKNYPLAFYAAQNWVDHARFGDVSSWIRDGMEQLFDPTKPHFSAWIWIHDVDRSWDKRSMTDLAERPSQLEATPLYYAAACGLHGLAEQLIGMRPRDVNARGGLHVFPLHVASYLGHPEVIRVLLEHGADINAKANDKRTPLHLASERGNVETMQLLLENGADTDAREDNNDSPFNAASYGGHFKAMELLLEHGVDVNLHGFAGWTPLHRATSSNALEVIRFLLLHGADVDARDVLGWTALHDASLNGYLEITQLLLEHGADVNAQSTNLRTPLHLVQRDGLEVARLLLKYGADGHARNTWNQTPFQEISEQGDHGIAQLLLGHGAREEKDVTTSLDGYVRWARPFRSE
jgi:ankyrin repeat protein